jgi:hypothetical protein
VNKVKIRTHFSSVFRVLAPRGSPILRDPLSHGVEMLQNAGGKSRAGVESSGHGWSLVNSHRSPCPNSRALSTETRHSVEIRSPRASAIRSALHVGAGANCTTWLAAFHWRSRLRVEAREDFGREVTLLWRQRIKLRPLTSFEDFTDWKQESQFLNDFCRLTRAECSADARPGVSHVRGTQGSQYLDDSGHTLFRGEV